MVSSIGDGMLRVIREAEVDAAADTFGPDTDADDLLGDVYMGQKRFELEERLGTYPGADP
jgi:hypothetical protein